MSKHLAQGSQPKAFNPCGLITVENLVHFISDNTSRDRGVTGLFTEKDARFIVDRIHFLAGGELILTKHLPVLLTQKQIGHLLYSLQHSREMQESWQKEVRKFL